jgi:hypothetical protein
VEGTRSASVVSFNLIFFGIELGMGVDEAPS